MEYTLLTVMAHHIGLYAFIQEVSINIKDLSLLLLTQIQDTTLQNNSYFFKKKKKILPTTINYTVSPISEPHIKLATFA